LRSFQLGSAHWAYWVVLQAPSSKVVRREDLFMRGSPSKELDFRFGFGFANGFVLEMVVGALELHFVCRSRRVFPLRRPSPDYSILFRAMQIRVTHKHPKVYKFLKLVA
jgi:hypothetical protein